mmetsp:Transcript_48744/g.104980  ORF Transcript_48744/g.104980 Transcript_48744/m.104980 type:complete len:218 (+) Transcript_48744:2315-2968(+)
MPAHPEHDGVPGSFRDEEKEEHHEHIQHADQLSIGPILRIVVDLCPGNTVFVPVHLILPLQPLNPRPFARPLHEAVHLAIGVKGGTSQQTLWVVWIGSPISTPCLSMCFNLGEIPASCFVEPKDGKKTALLDGQASVLSCSSGEKHHHQLCIGSSNGSAHQTLDSKIDCGSSVSVDREDNELSDIGPIAQEGGRQVPAPDITVVLQTPGCHVVCPRY